jgi:hypothetical protein
LPSKEPESPEQNNPRQDNNTIPQEAGRPKLSKDTEPRKEKRVLPRSSEPTSAILWGIEAQEKIAQTITPIICNHFGKKNATALSKSEVDQLEYLKLCIFTGMDPMIEVTPEIIHEVLKLNTKPTQAFLKVVSDKEATFNTVLRRKPTATEMRHIYSSSFAEIFCNSGN